MIWASWIILASISLSVIAILGVFIGAKEVLQRFKRSEDGMRQLEYKLQVVTTGAVGMGHRIVTLEKKLKSLTENQDVASVGSDDFVYSQAREMFKQGADVDTVASNCGFSNSEAELMALVQEKLKPVTPTS